MHFDEYRRYFDEQGPRFADASESVPSHRERTAACERPLGELGLIAATAGQIAAASSEQPYETTQ